MQLMLDKVSFNSINGMTLRPEDITKDPSLTYFKLTDKVYDKISKFSIRIGKGNSGIDFTKREVINIMAVSVFKIKSWILSDFKINTRTRDNLIVISFSRHRVYIH
jgi:hypothetical protein